MMAAAESICRAKGCEQQQHLLPRLAGRLRCNCWKGTFRACSQPQALCCKCSCCSRLQCLPVCVDRASRRQKTAALMDTILTVADEVGGG
jgi:hypothetical protein